MPTLYIVHRYDQKTQKQAHAQALADTKAEALAQVKPVLATENPCLYLVLNADGMTDFNAP